MKINFIDHVNIVVFDLESATKFFEQLGFVVKAKRELEGSWIDKTVGLDDVHARFVAMEIPGAQTIIELLSYDKPVGDVEDSISMPNQIGYRHIAFNVDSIEKWHKKLVTLGVECFSEVQEVPNYRDKKIFYFKGPEGIILELAEYPA